ncbi:uncharacterized protein VNE69_11109 [Vairimorpha necatrix]|uniref:Uncharacterized protein n=1 Tax=Vairimorpha necatrix TaxID=6039 RepID=A0AAX4JGE1_9MICR
MIVNFVYVLAIRCSEKIFVVTYGSFYADVYMIVQDEHISSTYLVTELVEEDRIGKNIKTYNKRSERGKNTEPFYFKPLTLIEKEILIGFLNCHRIINKEDVNTVNNFLNSKNILISRITLIKSKKYYIDVMKTKDLITVNNYSTSAKLVFSKQRKVYELKWSNFWNFRINKVPIPIPLLYQKNLLIFIHPRHQNEGPINISLDAENSIDIYEEIYSEYEIITVKEFSTLNNPYEKTESDINCESLLREMYDDDAFYEENIELSQIKDSDNLNIQKYHEEYFV